MTAEEKIRKCLRLITELNSIPKSYRVRVDLDNIISYLNETLTEIEELRKSKSLRLITKFDKNGKPDGYETIK